MNFALGIPTVETADITWALGKIIERYVAKIIGIHCHFGGEIIHAHLKEESFVSSFVTIIFCVKITHWISLQDRKMFYYLFSSISNLWLTAWCFWLRLDWLILYTFKIISLKTSLLTYIFKTYYAIVDK